MYKILVKINMRLIFFIFLVFSFEVVFSQESKVQQKHMPLMIDKKAVDCKDAILINVGKNTAFNYVVSPKGFGVQEISGSRDKMLLDIEHNSTWYLLTVKEGGELIFEITPIDSTNDYNFLLYRYTDSSTFCSAISESRISPLRGNFATPSLKSGFKTGLESGAGTNLVKKGAGASFSKSIYVKGGEKYMLLIDNVTAGGSGYGVAFSCVNELKISGKVTDDSKKFVKATVTLIDRNNKEIAKTSTSENGFYRLKAQVKETIDYSLLFYSDSCMPGSVIVNTNMLDTLKDTINVNQTMPKLKIGKTYNLLNFPGTGILLNVEGTAVLGLFQLMKKYPKMRIQIQGHAAKYELTKNSSQTNGGLKVDSMIAAERAEFVYQELLQLGIAKERLEKIGFSSDRPVFPNPRTEDEKKQNKRISIKILSL